MSRVGRLPIIIQDGVTITLKERNVTVKNAKGELVLVLPDGIDLKIDQGQCLVVRKNEAKKTRGLHGLYRSLINNMIDGLVKGYSKELELLGTGYRAKMEGPKISLSVGFSHPVVIDPPAGIILSLEGDTGIKISGFDKGLVGQTAANIRAIRPPDPYKGKGLRYKGEQIKLKPGKQMKSTTA